TLVVYASLVRRAEGLPPRLPGKQAPGLAGNEGWKKKKRQRRRGGYLMASRKGVGRSRRISRACSTKRTRAEIDDIRGAIKAILKDDHPMTVRQVFYALVVRNIIEKSEAEYQGTVIRLLTETRLSGAVSFNWIIDESRRRRATQTYDNIADAA